MRTYEGTGIGLAGVRTIVEQHGGTITVAGEEGRGSTLGTSIPCTATNPRPEARAGVRRA